jgi:hypothetical protein
MGRYIAYCRKPYKPKERNEGVTPSLILEKDKQKISVNYTEK